MKANGRASNARAAVQLWVWLVLSNRHRNQAADVRGLGAGVVQLVRVSVGQTQSTADNLVTLRLRYASTCDVEAGSVSPQHHAKRCMQGGVWGHWRAALCERRLRALLSSRHALQSARSAFLPHSVQRPLALRAALRARWVRARRSRHASHRSPAAQSVQA